MNDYILLIILLFIELFIFIINNCNNYFIVSDNNFVNDIVIFYIFYLFKYFKVSKILSMYSKV